MGYVRSKKGAYQNCTLNYYPMIVIIGKMMNRESLRQIKNDKMDALRLIFVFTSDDLIPLAGTVSLSFIFFV